MQPGEGFSVSSSVPELAQQMTATTAYLREKLDDLEANLKPLQGTWTGGGFEAYDRAQKDWDKALSDMSNDFSKASTTLNQAYESYQETDRNVSAIF